MECNNENLVADMHDTIAIDVYKTLKMNTRSMSKNSDIWSSLIEKSKMVDHLDERKSQKQTTNNILTVSGLVLQHFILSSNTTKAMK